MWWQNYSPTAQIFHIGGLNINWYGVLLVSAIIIAGYFSRKRLARDHIINYRQFEDLFFYVVIFGLIGARVGHVLFEFDYYRVYPGEMIKIWQGGISLFGSLLGGVLAAWWWCKKYKVYFLHVTDRILPFFALAQSIGRWGNYFNQELFGHPTNSWWGIYIAPIHRPPIYYQQNYFQPAFFLESFLDFTLFVILFFVSKKKYEPGKITALYVIAYSMIRFFMEFVRIDSTALVAGFRAPQLLSLLLFLLGLIIFFYRPLKTLSNIKK